MIHAPETLSVVIAAFLGAFVELVEAFTIILAAASIAGWRAALMGTLIGCIVLVALVAVLGPAMTLLPIGLLQIAIGLMLLLFGMRWLRKAILRGAGYIALHDEAVLFVHETDALRAAAAATARRTSAIAALAAFKGVMLEGIEVVFIVIAVGAGHGHLMAASLGALVAVMLVALIGVAVHRPLAQVPENTLKYLVGIMLSAFGVFWTGEGLGVNWPGADLIILVFIVIFLGVAVVATRVLRQRARTEATA